MIYVFEDKRILYKANLLRPEDDGKYIAVEKLPEVELEENQYAIYYADLEKGEVVFDIYENEPLPEPETKPEPPAESSSTILNNISEQLKALSEKYENEQNSTQEMILTLGSAIADLYEEIALNNDKS